MPDTKENVIELVAKRQDADKILKATASKNFDEAMSAMKTIAQVVEGAWKSGILEPDLLQGIFTSIPVTGDAAAKFPLDLYNPNKEEFYKAVVVPREGGIPEKTVDADEVYVPTYVIANAISWGLDFARDARWDVISRAIEVYTNGFTKKMNDDGWHTILKCAAFNSVVNDSAAASGTFTLNLITKLQIAMKRFTGGRGARLTDLYLSPEALGDLRNFASAAETVGTLDEATKRELLLNAQGDIPRFFGVNFHEMLELGFGQEYQTYLTATVGAALAAADDEFCVGLDLANRDAFVMPIREDMQMFEDPALHRQRKGGVYGWAEVGFACLDTRRSILGSL